MSDVSNFVNQVAGGGDFARSNLFEVVIPDVVDSRFLAKAASLPASTVNPIEVPYQNRKWKIPGDRIFADWTVTFLNDANYVLRNGLLVWQEVIQGHTTFSGDTQVAGAGVHKLLEIHPLNREIADQAGAAWTFSCWPTEIGSIELSWDTADQIQEYTVTFAVSWDLPS